MNVLITGGAGFIGYHLAKRFAEGGDDVTILENFARGRKDDYFDALCSSRYVQLLKLDITDANGIAALPHKFDYIYHFAAINGTENFYNIPDEVIKVGVLGAINILEWYSKNPRGRLILASTSEAYAGAYRIMGSEFPIPTPETVPLVVDDPRNVRWSYGASKLLSEVAAFSYAKARGFDDFCVVRFHNIYGPRMGMEHVIPQFIERIVCREDPFRIFGGSETRSFCHISDAVNALILVARSTSAKGEIIHIGCDDEISMLDLADKLMDLAGFHPKIEIRPAPKGSVQRRCPDISKLKKLGFAPKISIMDGLRECLDWYEPFWTDKRKGDD